MPLKIPPIHPIAETNQLGGSISSPPSTVRSTGFGTFKHTAMNARGHRIGTNDGKNWVDVQTGEPVR